MTTGPFTEAARAEAEEYTPTDEEVRTDYVMAYADRDSSQLLAGMAFDRWLAKRDGLILRQQRYIEELEAGRITPRTHLAAQEPTVLMTSCEETISDRLSDAGYTEYAEDEDGGVTWVSAPLGEVLRIVRTCAAEHETGDRA